MEDDGVVLYMHMKYHVDMRAGRMWVKFNNIFADSQNGWYMWLVDLLMQ